jgi:hypothetical protein
MHAHLRSQRAETHAAPPALTRERLGGVILLLGVLIELAWLAVIAAAAYRLGLF